MKTQKLPQVRQALAAAALASCALSAQAQGTAPPLYTVAKPLQFYPGTAKSTAMLSRIKDLQDLVAERYSVAMVDLNDDGRAEIIVQAESDAFCGSGGCMTMVVEQQGKRMVTLLTQNLGGSLGITQEKLAGYRALAGLDDKGGIAVADKKGTPLHGRQMVYPMAMAVAAVATPAAPAAPEAPAPSATAPSIAGISLGMDADAAMRALRTHMGPYGAKGRIVPRAFVVGNGAAATGSKDDYVHTYFASTDGFSAASNSIQKDTLSVILSPPPSRVIAVTRQLQFPVGKEVLWDAVVSQLRSLYGAEYDRRGLGYVQWYFDSAGKPSAAPAASVAQGKFCNAQGLSHFGGLMTDFLPPNFRKGSSYGELNPACGTVLQLYSTGRGPVTAVDSMLVDHRAVVDAVVDGRSLLGAQAEALRKQGTDKAGKNVAPRI